MTAGEVLARAADLLEQRGWCQGVSSDTDGRLCALGALTVAAVGSSHWGSVGSASVLVAAIRAVGHETGIKIIPEWNDSRGMTAHEIIATLRDSKRWLSPEDV